ncbi:MAG: hypothetical protein CV087_20800 [Candidatus Brocadia sp. WS118]|nr:MAG: hypothetical protein CV087_20800 [Candidatus Brocadia sp. WS118]
MPALSTVEGGQGVVSFPKTLFSNLAKNSQNTYIKTILDFYLNLSEITVRSFLWEKDKLIIFKLLHILT